MGNYKKIEDAFEHLSKTIDKFDQVGSNFDKTCDRMDKKIDSNNKYLKMIKYGQIGVIIAIVALIIKILWVSFNV